MAVERFTRSLAEFLREKAEELHEKRKVYEDIGKYEEADRATQERREILKQLEGINLLKGRSEEIFAELGISDPDVTLQQLFEKQLLEEALPFEPEKRKIERPPEEEVPTPVYRLNPEEGILAIDEKRVYFRSPRLVSLLSLLAKRGPGEFTSVSELASKILGKPKEEIGRKEEKTVYNLVGNLGKRIPEILKTAPRESPEKGYTLTKPIEITEESLLPEPEKLPREEARVKPPVEKEVPVEEEVPKVLLSIPKASEKTGMGEYTIYRWIQYPGLMEEGVHYIVVGKGKKQITRRITLEGIKRLKVLQSIQGERKLISRSKLLRELQKLEAKTISIAQAAEETGLSGFMLRRWCREEVLLEKGVHFVGERRQRRITPAGLKKLQLIEKIRGGRPLEHKTILKRLEEKEKREKLPKIEEIKPEEIKFHRDEACKLAHRLIESAERIEREFGLKISPEVRKELSRMWEERAKEDKPLYLGLVTLNELLIKLTEKLCILSYDPVAAYSQFEGNLPVQETILLLQGVEPKKRVELIVAILGPKPLRFQQAHPNAPLKRID